MFDWKWQLLFVYFGKIINFIHFTTPCNIRTEDLPVRRPKQHPLRHRDKFRRYRLFHNALKSLCCDVSGSHRVLMILLTLSRKKILFITSFCCWDYNTCLTHLFSSELFYFLTLNACSIWNLENFRIPE